jgi:hypothetical protein
MNWISVKDRLPEREGKDVLCFDGSDIFQASLFDSRYSPTPHWLRYDELEGDCYGYDGYGTVANVTHRMPLPKPPTK